MTAGAMGVLCVFTGISTSSISTSCLLLCECKCFALRADHFLRDTDARDTDDSRDDASWSPVSNGMLLVARYLRTFSRDVFHRPFIIYYFYFIFCGRLVPQLWREGVLGSRQVARDGVGIDAGSIRSTSPSCFPHSPLAR
mgnify:FL=1